MNNFHFHAFHRYLWVLYHHPRWALVAGLGAPAGTQGESGNPVMVLLLPEGGYAPLNPLGWIKRLRPQVVLLSAVAGDRQGLPSPETLEAVQGYMLMRTDRNGWIELTTDGKQM
jgi:hypothetical protein